MTISRISRRVAAVAVAVAALAAAPAHAFDAGPHTDMTRDAFTSEGFGATAADVGVVENWFVDYYWNAKDEPVLRARGLRDDARPRTSTSRSTSSLWPQAIIEGTNHMHFDSSASSPTSPTPRAIDEEWQRLMKVTRAQLVRARAARTRSPSSRCSA